MVIESNSIDEFVNDDGSMIGGDERYNKGVDVKTGPINMPGDEKGISVTTDKHAANAIQPRNWWWSLSYGYGQGKGKSPIGSNIGLNSGGDNFNESEKVDEDVLSKQSNNKDLVKRTSTSDVNRNGIPEIKTLPEKIGNKLTDLIETIVSSKLSPEEVGVVLNHFVRNVNTSEIPSDYKNIIRKQL